MSYTRVWRICHKQFKDSAFSGEGARTYGGRFNSEGKPAVYTSGNLSLALLEMLVQANDRSILSGYVMLSADIPDQMIYSPDTNSLPKNWNNIPYRHSSQQFGDDWLISKSSAALKIPSVVLPVEFNYVLNPLYPLFHQVQYSEPEILPFDQRLKGS